MPRITLIGAGSTVFAKNLLGDILSFPELAESHIALMDIDSERLRTSELAAQKVAKSIGAHPRITSHTNRREALEGANYAINMIQVAGYKPGTVTCAYRLLIFERLVRRDFIAQRFLLTEIGERHILRHGYQVYKRT